VTVVLRSRRGAIWQSEHELQRLEHELEIIQRGIAERKSEPAAKEHAKLEAWLAGRKAPSLE
jgi:hypothetical protein